MLILSRRANQSLRIGNNVVITVVGFNGNQIKLGITAPANVIVDREEVHLRKIAEQIPTLSPVTETIDAPSAALPTPPVRIVRRRSAARQQLRLRVNK